MFAQYNQQYQQQAAGGAAVSTNGMVWNGNAWVAAAPNAAAAATGAHSTYSTGAYAAAETPASLVTKYTQYYHQWTTRAKEQEQQVQRFPLNSPQRTEAQQHADWSKYYADQASRAAHHYHSSPHTPAPFELPPAPPAAGVAGQQQQQQQPVVSTPSPVVKKASRWSTQAPMPAASADPGPPDGLKRYVHRCLAQCTTPEQTKTVERETEQVIARALQAGTLHATNWDAAPLIPIPGAKKREFSPQGHYGGRPESSKKPKFDTSNHDYSQSHSNSNSYYGPSSGGGGGTETTQPSPSSWNNGFHHHQGQSTTTNNSGSYYGPAASSSPTNPTSPNSQHSNSYYQSQQQQQSKYQPGYYGSDTNQDFIAVPQQFGSKKNGKKNSNKYVNPNSTKHKKKAMNINMNDGFQRTSTTMANRANRFSGPGGNDDVRNAKAKGIDDRYMGKGVIGGSNKKLDETDYEHMKVKGTCRKLEKQYLRLTAPPKPELVRPLEILQQHLKNLKAEWKLPSKRREYLWFCAEMKSMRQDLTVQHITNAFTVDVYETHARMALQEGDLNEFNQAQTQLKILYEKLPEDPKALENQNEFVAYLVIYFVMLLLNKKYNGGSSDLLNLMLSLTPSQREQDPAIRHALQVRAAVAEVDYHKFFRLHSSCPNLGGKLMDLMVPTIRHWALQRVCKAYKPTAEVVVALKALGWNVDEPEEVEDGKKFLLSCGCVLSDDGTEIKTKDSVVRESDLQEKQSLI